MADDFGARLLIYSFIGLVAGIVAFFHGFGSMRLKRMIEDTPTSKIRGIAMGLVEVYGQALPTEKPLKSPLSGADCVYYKYLVEELRSSGKSTYWATIKSGQDNAPFYVKDDTGQVLVDPQGADIDIPANFHWQTSLARPMPQSVMAFLDDQHLAYKGIFGYKQLRCTEYYIAPKDKLYVMGTAGENPLVKSSADHEEMIMIQKGKNSPFYYISDSAEKDILSKLHWKVIWAFYGGGALAVIWLAYIFMYLGIL